MAFFGEWDTPETIVVHPLGQESMIPSLHPASALYEGHVDIAMSNIEMNDFKHILEKLTGAKVISVQEAFNLVPQEKKVELAIGSVEVEFESGFPEHLKSAEVQNVIRLIRLQTSEALFKLILERPTITLKQTNTNTGWSAEYTFKPLMNLIFMRDQAITTPVGRIMGKMNSIQRDPEKLLVKAIYEALGDNIVMEISGDGKLEGGDYLPAGPISLIGVGLRTNQEGVNQLLERDAFGTDYVLVAKDKWRDQEEMHLDTYCNVVDSDLVVLVDRRTTEDENDIYYVAADLYFRSSPGEGYVLVERNVPFTYMLRHFGFKIIPMPKSDQLLYGVNFLTVGPRQIVMPKLDSPLSKTYLESLKQEGVVVHFVKMEAITKAYGAAHCTTQVRRRLRHNDRRG